MSRQGSACPPRILVTGSRDWDDEQAIGRALAAAWARLGSHPQAVLVHGACHLGGADLIADRLWRSWGLPVEAHPAELGPDGRVLGPARNARMVAAGADVCLAFPLPGSRGTRNCIRLARQAGIEVVVHERSEARPARPGNRVRPPLGAAMRTATGGGEHWAREPVRRDGLALVAVGGDEPYAYTVGMTGHGHHEVLLAGLPAPTTAAVIEAVCAPVLAGRAPAPGPGPTTTAFAGGVPGHYVRLSRKVAAEQLRVACVLYGDRVRALQLCWPDRQGRFPWQAGSLVHYPVLGRP